MKTGINHKKVDCSAKNNNKRNKGELERMICVYKPEGFEILPYVY